MKTLARSMMFLVFLFPSFVAHAYASPCTHGDSSVGEMSTGVLREDRRPVARLTHRSKQVKQKQGFMQTTTMRHKMSERMEWQARWGQ